MTASATLSAPYELVTTLAEDVLDTLEGQEISTVLITLAIAMRRAATEESPSPTEEIRFMQAMLQYANLILINGESNGIH